MIINFCIHGIAQPVYGELNIGDSPVPDVGWELSFDAVASLRVASIEGCYDAAGEQTVTLNLTFLPGSEREWTGQKIVDFFWVNDDLTAFSKVELGGWCYCRLCRSDDEDKA